MEPNTWLEVPDSKIGNVLAPRHAAPLDGGVTGPEGVFTAWSGSAFDPVAHRQYFCGSGYTDYSGNEVYCFDYELLQWFQLTEPSRFNTDDSSRGEDRYQTEDEKSISSHSCDGLCWCPDTKTLFVWVGASNPILSGSCWEFDPATAKWNSVLPSSGTPTTGQIISAKWSEKRRKILVTNGRTAFWFNPILKTCGTLGTDNPDIGASTGVLDDAGDAFYSIYRGGISKISLSDAALEDTSDALAAHAAQLGSQDDRAPNIRSVIDGGFGWIWNPKRRVATWWSGTDDVGTFDPVTSQFCRYRLAAGSPAPTSGHPVGPRSKLQYISDLDVYVGFNNPREGVWVFRPGARTPIVAQIGGVTVTKPVGTVVKYNSPSFAAQQLEGGETVSIAAGEFADGMIINASNVTVEGAQGVAADGRTPLRTRLRGVLMQGGIGILVINGNNTTVNNLEISGAVTYDNSSAIRLLGKNFIGTNLWLHGCDTNWLSAGTNGDIVFNNVWATDSIKGNLLNHNIYVSVSGNGGPTSFTMNGGGSLRASGHGHLVKSRALETTIKGAVIAMLDANGSRCIDICDDGLTVITANVLEMGPDPDNNDAIGIALEYSDSSTAAGFATVALMLPDGKYSPDPKRQHHTTIENNIFINDQARNPHANRDVALVHSRSPGTVVLGNNQIFNASILPFRLFDPDPANRGVVTDAGGNRIINSRSTLGPYPSLPPPPKAFTDQSVI